MGFFLLNIDLNQPREYERLIAERLKAGGTVEFLQPLSRTPFCRSGHYRVYCPWCMYPMSPHKHGVKECVNEKCSKYGLYFVWPVTLDSEPLKHYKGE
jgi:hypothetical protein